MFDISDSLFIVGTLEFWLVNAFVLLAVFVSARLNARHYRGKLKLGTQI
jgi:hypothetical protein